ncbi:MAG: UvrD-helicase domain-containing protein [Deltaproteobacteria bacterium]|jgi:ATP-dependent exoDNAse (exonuclease V) beta subunit|nr:UvrD-helicase domain-containing protein [Deltaproteobacteria bacterium]
MCAEFNSSQKAVLSSRSTFSVVAGAGSGKTGTLVEYIVRYIEDDLERNSITDVLALTFSEKAAAEMSERVSKALRKRLREANDAGDDKTAAQWEREIRRLGQSQIGTIHSYAFGLVKNYSYLASLSSSVSVDQSASPVDDLDEVLKDLLNAQNADLATLLRVLSLTKERGYSISNWLMQCLIRQSSWGLKGLTSGVKPPSAPLASLVEAFVKAVRSAAEYLESGDLDEKKYPRPAEGVRALQAIVDQTVSSAPSVDTMVPGLDSFGSHLMSSFINSFNQTSSAESSSIAEPATARSSSANGKPSAEPSANGRGVAKKAASGKNFSLDEKDLPKFLMEADPLVAMLSSLRRKGTHNHKAEINDAFKKLLFYQSSLETAPLTEALVRLANAIPDLIRKKRASRSQISFDDILSKARDLLKNYPRVRAEESARWRLIMVDEFQDTNRLQADLLAQIIPNEGHGFSWSNMDWANLPPKLKVVGDPKQSIYRFRGSEPAIMNVFSETLAQGGGESLVLDSNYRSQSHLIDFFNAFFSQILEEKYTPQTSVRERLYEGRSVVWLTGTDQDAKRTMTPMFQAALMVSYLHDLFSGRAGVMVADKGQGGEAEGPPRLPRPSDVAILLRRRRYSEVYQEALTEAGFPCHTLKGQNLFESPEVTGLASAYLYMCGREPDVNLVGALNSPLGPVSEETITALIWPEAPKPTKRSLSWYFQDEGRPWPTGLDSFDESVLVRLRQLLLTLKPYVLRRPPGEIIECMVEERNLLPLLIAGDGGSPERVRNVQYFMAFLKTIPFSDQYRPESAADVIEDLMTSGLETGESEDDSLTGIVDAGSINIMTVHRSKGLEFPVVFIPEADSQVPPNNSGLVISEEGQVVVKFPSEHLDRKLEPPEFAQFKDKESAFTKAENKRLLYVAATRARDHLVFLGQKPKNPNDSWLSVLTSSDCFEECASVLEPEIGYEGDKPVAENMSEDLPEILSNPVKEAEGEFLPAMVKPARLSDFFQLSVSMYCRIFAAFKKGAPTIDDAYRMAWMNESLDEIAFVTPVGPKDGPTSPTHRGVIFHAMMEASSFDLDEQGYRALASEKAAWKGYLPSDEEIAFLASKAMRFQLSDYGQELKQTMEAGRLYRREWPFWLRIDRDEYNFGPIHLGGVIDLFYVNDKGQGRIIDYKLAKASPSPVYDKQLEIYAMAVKKAGFTGELETKLWYSGA